MSTDLTFKQLGLPDFLLSALNDLGYERPSPIQLQSIPAMLDGHDVIAQAQTGTGKTAGFALPILSQIDVKLMQPQALIITPTRELSIQVAEALQSYAKYMPGFHVLPIYGGQQYATQLKALKRGLHVVVGTPGRIMDHLRRNTLSLNSLRTIVLDEADEMLKMGFIDDVRWILQQISGDHQTALFSATLPASIQKIAQDYLHQPVKLHIEPGTKTVAAIDQKYTLVAKEHKLEALTRFLEVEDFEAAIIFVRTKVESVELADKLEARGYSVAALNGDIAQAQREKVIVKIKRGDIDIVVATEVAARGLDVERMGYVINYDIPTDPESYVHRIGRTGRAGRAGKALLFVTPRERGALRLIERTIGQTIPMIDPPSVDKISSKRTTDFMDKIRGIIVQTNLEAQRKLLSQMVEEHDCSMLDIASALAYLAQKEKPIHNLREIPIAKYTTDAPPARARSGAGRGKPSDRSGAGASRDRYSDRGRPSGDRPSGDREGNRNSSKEKPRYSDSTGASRYKPREGGNTSSSTASKPARPKSSAPVKRERY